jgi:hypothetical protein
MIRMAMVVSLMMSPSEDRDDLFLYSSKVAKKSKTNNLQLAMIVTAKKKTQRSPTPSLTAVGYANNWIAIKSLFEPADPVDILGLFQVQGLFESREIEVSN